MTLFKQYEDSLRRFIKIRGNKMGYADAQRGEFPSVRPTRVNRYPNMVGQICIYSKYGVKMKFSPHKLGPYGIHTEGQEYIEAMDEAYIEGYILCLKEGSRSVDYCNNIRDLLEDGDESKAGASIGLRKVAEDYTPGGPDDVSSTIGMANIFEAASDNEGGDDVI